MDSVVLLRSAEEVIAMDFEAFFSTSPIPFALCEENGDLVSVNQAFAKLIGRTIAETLALSYWHITPKKYREQETVQLQKLKTHHRYGPYQKEYLHKDGSLVPVLLSGWHITSNNGTRILSAVQDLREELAHLAYVGLALCDMSGKLLMVNRYYANMLGYTTGEVLQKKYWDITPESYAADEEERLRELRENGYYEPYNKMYKTKGGREIDVWLVGRKVTINGEDFIWSVVQEGQYWGDIGDLLIPTFALPKAKKNYDRPIKKVRIISNLRKPPAKSLDESLKGNASRKKKTPNGNSPPKNKKSSGKKKGG